jgi:hypothetical protein
MLGGSERDFVGVCEGKFDVTGLRDEAAVGATTRNLMVAVLPFTPFPLGREYVVAPTVCQPTFLSFGTGLYSPLTSLPNEYGTKFSV